MTEEQRNSRTIVVIVCINLSVALLHFLTGRHYAGPFPEFVNGYLLDILIPFAWYFLLCLLERKVKSKNVFQDPARKTDPTDGGEKLCRTCWSIPPCNGLTPWYVKSALVFAVGSSVEIAQFFGVPIFGRTFDPMDFVMYGSGGVLAAICDRILFPKIFKFWRPDARKAGGKRS